MHHLLLIVTGAAVAAALPVTLRSQSPSTVGREEWITTNRVVEWEASKTAIIVVDMWDKHWCTTATTRVAELATPMNATLESARKLGVQVVFAPSDVTSFYASEPARLRTVALPRAELPPRKNLTVPPFPLSTATNDGCDVPDKPYAAWKRQIATLAIDSDRDFIIAADLPGDADAGERELHDIAAHLGLENLIYMGVHENMCIMERPFAIERVSSRGWPRAKIAVARELVDAMYTPLDAPYVPHATGVELQTGYIERFWGNSVSMYDLLVPEY